MTLDLSGILDPADKLGPALAALTADPQPTPSREQRVAEARAAIEANNPSVRAAQGAARMAWENGRRSYSAREAILTARYMADEQRRRVAAHDATYENTTLVSDLAAITRPINGVRALVLPVAPDFAPANATDADRINGVAADSAKYDPITFRATLRAGIARGDLALVARLVALGRSFVAYKPPFQSAEMADLLQQADDALATPDVVQSDAAREWVEQATQDARSLISTLRKGHGQIDPVYVVVGALPALFPDRVAPSA